MNEFEYTYAFAGSARGVFQTLVEKHFPAPDRERINRLLGLEKNKVVVAVPARAPAAPPNGKHARALDDPAAAKRKRE